MNKNIAQKEWQELKGIIKSKWARFTDNDLSAVEGNMDEIVGRLQRTYGFAEDRAQQEYRDFQNALNSSSKDTPPPTEH